MKFAEKFLNMMKLNDADDETEPFDEEYNEVTEEEGYDEEEMEDEEEEPHKPILSLRRKKKDLTESMILCACPISIPSKFTTIVLPSFKKSATICASLNV